MKQDNARHGFGSWSTSPHAPFQHHVGAKGDTAPMKYRYGLALFAAVLLVLAGHAQTHAGNSVAARLRNLSAALIAVCCAGTLRHT